ncbi:MAG: aminoglycoside 6-adenylyltransferase [Bacteroidota bacterium]
MKARLLRFAQSDERVRAVLLNGSRANDQIPPDRFQDYDIVFLVREFEYFIDHPDWITVFGKPILKQLPDAMCFGTDPAKVGFTYLIVFEDDQRLDLTLFPLEQFPDAFLVDSLTKVWLDKDQLFTDLPPADDSDYQVQRPTAMAFRDHCNEFWWVYPYIAKALMRGEVIHAQQLLNGPLREMFHWMLRVYLASQHGFSISLGKGLRFLPAFLSESSYQEVLNTYPSAEKTDILRALHLMARLFSEYAQALAEGLEFEYQMMEEVVSRRYFERLMHE